jgi:hypothetical protein
MLQLLLLQHLCSAIGSLLVRRDLEIMHLLYQRSDGRLKYVDHL